MDRLGNRDAVSIVPPDIDGETSNRKRTRLFREFGGLCRWCGRSTRLVSPPAGVGLPDDAATVDHIASRFVRKPGQAVKTVLACYKCNQERNDKELQQMRSSELRKRSMCAQLAIEATVPTKAPETLPFVRTQYAPIVAAHPMESIGSILSARSDAEMTIPDIRPLELLALWSELDDAYNGKNGYGGDTAELYAYRFDVYSPQRHLRDKAPPEGSEAEANTDRSRRLYDLLTLFAKQRDCIVSINGQTGRKIGRWILASEFWYRVHVRVARKAR